MPQIRPSDSASHEIAHVLQTLVDAGVDYTFLASYEPITDNEGKTEDFVTDFSIMTPGCSGYENGRDPKEFLILYSHYFGSNREDTRKELKLLMEAIEKGDLVEAKDILRTIGLDFEMAL